MKSRMKHKSNRWNQYWTHRACLLNAQSSTRYVIQLWQHTQDNMHTQNWLMQAHRHTQYELPYSRKQKHSGPPSTSPAKWNTSPNDELKCKRTAHKTTANTPCHIWAIAWARRDTLGNWRAQDATHTMHTHRKQPLPKRTRRKHKSKCWIQLHTE